MLRRPMRWELREVQHIIAILTAGVCEAVLPIVCVQQRLCPGFCVPGASKGVHMRVKTKSLVFMTGGLVHGCEVQLWAVTGTSRRGKVIVGEAGGRGTLYTCFVQRRRASLVQLHRGFVSAAALRATFHLSAVVQCGGVPVLCAAPCCPAAVRTSSYHYKLCTAVFVVQETCGAFARRRG